MQDAEDIEGGTWVHSCAMQPNAWNDGPGLLVIPQLNGKSLLPFGPVVRGGVPELKGTEFDPRRGIPAFTSIK